MQCILMNFDDRIRVIPDLKQAPISVNVGEMKACDIDPAYITFIKNAMVKTNDPLVILEQAAEFPPEIAELMDILRNIRELDYHTLLTRATNLVGATNWSSLQPSVEEIRYRLRAVAARFAHMKIVPDSAALAAEAARIKAEQDAAAQPITDDEDPDKLDEALRKQREAENAAKRDKEAGKKGPQFQRTAATDRMDEALGIGIGADLKGLGEALGSKPAPGDDDSFDESAGRPERPTRKKAAKKAAAKKTAPTARSAKPAKGAKKTITRIRS